MKKPATAKLPVEIVASYPREKGTVYLEWFSVAEPHRRRGVGRQAYEQWERELPRTIKTVRLHAAEVVGFEQLAAGSSSAFWEALGFNYRWGREEIKDAAAKGADTGELEQEMEKKRTLFPAKKSRKQLDSEIAAALKKRSRR